MKILLANPGSRHAFRYLGFVYPPSGLLYVAAYAEKMGCNVTVKDFCIADESPEDFSFSEYDIVGITTDTRQYRGAETIAREARKSGCTVVMGGSHAQFVADEVLRAGHADFIVHGEGEITFHELTAALDRGDGFSGVNGISYRNNGDVITTSPRELIEDLDSLPFPARHLIDMEAYAKAGLKYGHERSVAIVSTSRGCSHNCFFCAIPSISGRRWRCRSVDSIMSEIDYLYHTYGYRAVAFCDDNFTVSTKRVKELCRRIIDGGYRLWWWSMSSPGTLGQNEDMVELMAQAGAKTIFIGVESASEDVLKGYNKQMKGTTAEQAVAVLKKHNIEIYASYILGGLNDSVRSILKTIRFARKLDSNVAQFTILTPYPGTDLYKKIKKVITDTSWHRFDGFHLVFKHEQVFDHC